MRLTFLGTGTSFGIPVIGCGCETCTSDDPRDRRNRHAALLQDDTGAALLIDMPPELRLQLTGAGIGRVEAVWITHCHADHIHGVDDLRALSARHGHLDIWAGPECAEILRHRFEYIFSDYRPPRGTTKPELRLRTFRPLDEVRLGPFTLRALPVQHGPVTAFGFRVGDLGYITDAKRLAPGTRETLAGVRTLVLNALWFGNPHPTHLNVEEAVELAHEIGAERTYLTHLTHRLRHAHLEAELPADVRPAYDGLTIDV